MFELDIEHSLVYRGQTGNIHERSRLLVKKSNGEERWRKADRQLGMTRSSRMVIFFVVAADVQL